MAMFQSPHRSFLKENPIRKYQSVTPPWNQSWKHTTIGEVKSRIRRPVQGMRAHQIWREIERVVRHPTATREVWVVMGAGLSRAAFESSQRKEHPPANVIQLIYLLQSTWSTVSSLGAIF